MEKDVWKIKKIAPLKAIFMSTPFWALLIAQSTQNFSAWTLLTEIPSFFKTLLNVNLSTNGLMTAIPYIFQFILSISYSYMSDYVINKKIISRTTARKLANSIAFCSTSIFLVALSYTPAGDVTTAMILFTCTVGLGSGYYVGYVVNHMDLSPNFAGTLMGICNTSASTMALLAPLTAGFIIKDETDLSDWRIVFFFTSGLLFLGSVVFIIFGSAEKQPWNEFNKTEDACKIETANVKPAEPGNEKSCSNDDVLNVY